MLDLKPVFEVHSKRMVAQARRNLSSNKRGRFSRINTTKRLYNSLKFKTYSNKIEFYFEEYGITVDRGLTGQRGKAMPGNYKSVFNPRGRITRKPPVGRIHQWMRQKGVGETRSHAYNIAEKIKREGLQPKLWFTDAFESRYPILQKAVQDEVDKYIQEKMEQES